jgi:hypothetical protein
MKLIVGLPGSSGVIFGVRLLEVLPITLVRGGTSRRFCFEGRKVAT